MRSPAARTPLIRFSLEPLGTCILDPRDLLTHQRQLGQGAPYPIAVYASRPLSPVATQHSLPSGRCSLLGPNSTGWIAPACLAHSFDYLVGAGEQD
jgi:hypothetical protein